MSKRSFIIAALAVVLFIAAIFSVVMDFKQKQEPENDQEPEQESAQKLEKKPGDSITEHEIVDSDLSDEVNLEEKPELQLKTKKTVKNA